MAKRRTVLQGLKWAKWADAPSFSDKPAPKGAMAAGIRYEKRIARKLLDIYGDDCKVTHGPWIQFEDKTGVHFAQPDVLIEPADVSLPLIVVEIKLSHRPFAERKLRRLYGPLVRRALDLPAGRRMVLIQVFKSVRHRQKLPVEIVSITDFLDIPRGNDYLVCHCFG